MEPVAQYRVKSGSHTRVENGERVTYVAGDGKTFEPTKRELAKFGDKLERVTPPQPDALVEAIARAERAEADATSLRGELEKANRRAAKAEAAAQAAEARAQEAEAKAEELAEQLDAVKADDEPSGKPEGEKPKGK